MLPLVCAVILSPSAFPQCLRRGNANCDAVVDMSDAISILGYLFLSALNTDCLEPCPDRGDANDDGKLDLSDAVYLLNYLFLGGPDIPPPADPGQDPTPDALPCDCFVGGAPHLS